MLQFAKKLHRLRKEQQLTQAHIAQRVGVSKAAVSKWETGLSYPDITVLPKLAAYLNVSIDELLGYEPQMSDAQIRQTYTRLSNAFASEPFDDVFQEVEQLIADYYTCFPLLNQLCVLLLNYLNKARDASVVTARIRDLCQHIQRNSDDFVMIEQARGLEATIYLQQQQPEKVHTLLGDDIALRYGIEGIISMAHAQLGQPQRAEQVLQVALYQHIAEMFNYLTQLLLLQVHDDERFSQTVARGTMMAETFDLITLNAHHPLSFHLIAAQCYMQRGEADAALTQLQRYVAYCSRMTLPFTLRGDEYFHHVDAWIAEHHILAGDAPRDEQSIKDDLYGQVAHNQAFLPLQPTLAFRQLLHQLQQAIKGGF